MNRKNILLTAVVILFLVIILLTIVNYLNTGNGQMISPNFIRTLKTNPSPSPVPSPSSTPKTFKFERSTDLKAELETVNPQVLDSDFNE